MTFDGCARYIPSAKSALALSAAIALGACDPSGVIEDLGTLGGPRSIGLGINAVGNVTGSSFLSGDLHGGGMHTFLFISGLGMLDVGTLPGGNIGEGQGLNDGNIIAGGALVDVGGDSVGHGFVASATFDLTDLGALGGDFSFAMDINNAGQVTGLASIANGDSHAFRWTRDAGMTDLGTLGGNQSTGHSINESGQIAGESRIGSGTTTRAFRFTDGAGMVSLGTLPGGTNSSAFGINNSGQVVGQSDTGPILDPGLVFKGLDLFGTHAFLWSEGAGMTDLGHLGGGTSVALAISNTGIVVGTSTTANGVSRAFRWTQAEGLVDLNTVIPANSGWVLEIATDVNDRGQITGQGLHNGARRAFRFNPREILNELKPK